MPPTHHGHASEGQLKPAPTKNLRNKIMGNNRDENDENGGWVEDSSNCLCEPKLLDPAGPFFSCSCCSTSVIKSLSQNSLTKVSSLATDALLKIEWNSPSMVQEIMHCSLLARGSSLVLVCCSCWHPLPKHTRTKEETCKKGGAHFLPYQAWWILFYSHQSINCMWWCHYGGNLRQDLDSWSRMARAAEQKRLAGTSFWFPRWDPGGYQRSVKAAPKYIISFSLDGALATW